ncbi:hypothetical protein ACHAXT_012364 [Thalassiosira profunda]
MTLLRLLLLLLGTGLSIVDASSEATNHDEWCADNCSTLEDCNAHFADNHVDLRLRVKFSIDDGPGGTLLDKYFGTTVSRQSFDTQFVLDVASALETSPCRLYVTSVFPEGTEQYWDTESVFVEFRLFPADAAFVATLTRLTQEPKSAVYDGHITYATDALYGLVASQWDHSIKLTYAISIVGGADGIESDRGRYLNQGSAQACAGREVVSPNSYCEFEALLTRDMEMALELKAGQFLVLFVKEADRHSVIVSFRLVLEASMDGSGQDTAWIQSRGAEIVRQMNDAQSPLYGGNVSFKADPTWGISGIAKQTRQFTKYQSRPAPSTPSDEYERCKATHRCPRAWSYYNQSTAESSHTFQEYQGGEHVEAGLFLDFEDWRRGIRGWEQSCRGDSDGLCLPEPASVDAESEIPLGAHWSPFGFESLGPSVPTGKSWNNGLVLNKQRLEHDIQDQSEKIEEYEALVQWMDEEFQHGLTDNPFLRSRQQIIANITNYTDTLAAEKEILAALTQSQCTNVDCNLLFNTSDATLSGAVNVNGVIATTPDGTEVALWAFDSIDIDENVNVTLTGQRAMALVSRSSAHVNTTLHAVPGTLGGFPGGFSVSRRPNERLVRVCTEQVDSRDFLDVCGDKASCCPGDQPIGELANGVVSNNVNGPGSPSQRVYLMTIQTSATVVNEIQTVTTNANRGQTLSGGFRLHFIGYSTPFLPHDITASQLKRKMEDSLNPVKPNQLRSFDRTDSVAGIGAVGITRETFGTSGGYKWSITFASAVGDIAKDSSQLTATNELVSRGARVDVETTKHGNSIGGAFALQFLGNETRFMPHDVSASVMEDVLRRDIPSLSTAHVLRSDPTDNCNDGYCDNGADRSGGYIWTLTLTTQDGNVSPPSPTSALFDNEGDVASMAAVNQLTGCVDSQCPTIDIEMGHWQSHNHQMRSINGSKPFSLAYGGAGAGHGGRGGDGFGDVPPGESYGSERIANLYGGSGGGVGVKQPFQLGHSKEPRGRGGSGGGAIEIIAANDIVLGSNAVVSCDGEAGASAYMTAGGGGSGGAILLAAGGVVQIDGQLSVAGGEGGHKKVNMPKKVESFGGHGGGGSGGRIAAYGQSVMIGEESAILFDGGNCSATATASYNCTGGRGTLLVESALDTELSVDFDVGAAGTRSSLHLRPRTKIPAFDPRKMLPSIKSGPEFDMGRSVRADRVSFYYRVDNPSTSGWDATFELRDSRWSYLASQDGLAEAATVLVGLTFGSEVRHGVNYNEVPFDDQHVKHLNAIQRSVPPNTWIKVDIRFDWERRTHDVYVDDVRVVKSSPFVGEGIRVISLGNFYEGSKVWFDEIYVGKDTMLGFACPVVLPDGTLEEMDRPLEKGWKAEDLGELSSLRDMQRHESHVSRRAVYQREDNKFVVPFDGEGENDFSSDVKFRANDGDRVHEKGKVVAGSLLRLPRQIHEDEWARARDAKANGEHGMEPDTFVWYGEHDHLQDPRLVSGAVMACSTQDFLTWKLEGAMLHYQNLTDMVHGDTGPLHLEKAKVLYNNSTQQYVMWFLLDNGVRELGLAGVAVSDYANGPFAFVRSFYPDGNQTRDQTLFQDDDGSAYLFRTFYDTVEYVLPAAQMQPTWESVKNADGSINFALSYHRAEYHPGYDDYHDIYLQRWRTEDKPWQVVCVDRLTGKERVVPYGKEHLNLEGEVCNDPFERKEVRGQGSPAYENSKDGIQSRFLDPNDPANNAWVPNSVPGLKGQPWKANSEGGVCGLRKVNDDMQHFDPNLPNREVPDRRECSNIVDNPIHPTLPDERIGPSEVVERRRAKYVAVSRLTDDYLDTNGVVRTFAGELVGRDLLELARQYNTQDSFGWTSGFVDAIGSTFQPQVHDVRFSQDRAPSDGRQPNDRASYSPACVFDGQCSKNG